MKKGFGILVSILIILNTAVCAYAAEYQSPFDKGTLNSDCYRIPAVYTLNDGSVIAAADMRYGHGADSPGNIDIVTAVSGDGYSDWKYTVVNHFDDYADGENAVESASYIDSAIAQTSSGRIFLISDAFPSGGGYNQALRGTGFVAVDGENRMLLTDGENSDKLSSFKYYIGAFSDGIAEVFTLSGEATAYTVDEEYRLYKNSEPLYVLQVGSDKKVQQNVFYNKSELCCYRTAYLIMRYSDDNGKTWSAPVNLSAQIKNDDESFLGICPGRGFVTSYNGKERIIFTVYDNCGLTENVSTIYSDDNGRSWHRGKETDRTLSVLKTSESQIVDLGDKLRMYARNNYSYIAYADSTDGGVSWTEFRSDYDLSANGNCMSSFINAEIGDKNFIFASYPSDNFNRKNGVIRTGVVTDGEVEWIKAYNVNEGFYAYSCITQLSDGKIALLYEDEAAHISYKILSLDSDGELSEINGENAEQKEKSLLQKVLDLITKSFGELLNKILDGIFGFIISLNLCS